jgi:hypothetical protein
MKRWIMVALAAVIVAGSAAAEDGAENSDPAAEMAMMQEMMEKYGSPGPEHAYMEPFVGAWTYTTKAWMMPDTDPMSSTGTCEYAWIHGGRFMSHSIKGNMMGMPFTGTGMMGYDRYKNELFSLWMDSMGTGMMVSRGSVSDDGKTFTLIGHYDDYWTGHDNKWTKTVMTVHGPDSHQLEMYVKGEDGEPWRNFVIDYTRAEIASK